MSMELSIKILKNGDDNRYYGKNHENKTFCKKKKKFKLTNKNFTIFK